MRTSRVKQGIQASICVLALGLISTSANAQLGANTSKVKSDAPSVVTTIEPSATYTGVAHVANGASLRNASSATIRLRGMPSDANVIEAFLYWDFASVTTPTYAQSNVIFSRQFHLVNSIAKVYGTQIGIGADPCWFGGSNFAYRADVTKWVRGNGDFVVTLLPGASSSTNGSDPWGPSAPTSGPLAEGASIVAIYTSSLEPTGTVLLYDSGLAGTEFEGTLSYDLDQVPTPPGVTTSIFTELGADGQVGGSQIGLSLTPEFAQKTTQLNSIFIAGPGSAVNDGDWNGTDGIPLNQLWDTHSHDVSGLLVAGLNNVTTFADDDCLVAVANVLTVR
jgi:hypothetical protein